MPKVEWIDFVLALVELTAFALNILTLYLISKLRLKDVDMILGVVMAVCDLILSGFKLLELPILLIFGKDSFLTKTSVILPTCGILLVVVICSIACVGYLGIIRWLAICRGRNPDKLRYWLWIFTGHMIFLLIVAIISISKQGLVTMTRERYYYPDFHIENTWGFFFRIVVAITMLGCFITFNGCYIMIALRYLTNLNNIYNCQSRVEKEGLLFEKIKIISKIAVMLLLYNITIVPFFMVDIIELITATQRTLIADKLSSSGLACIAFVNPAMLITMHCETWREFRRLFSTQRKSVHYPILDDNSAIIDLQIVHSKETRP